MMCSCHFQKHQCCYSLCTVPLPVELAECNRCSSLGNHQHYSLHSCFLGTGKHLKINWYSKCALFSYHDDVLVIISNLYIFQAKCMESPEFILTQRIWLIAAWLSVNEYQLLLQHLKWTLFVGWPLELQI